jgi:hypothetical protein
MTRGGTAFLSQRAFFVVMRLDTPGLARFVNVVGFDAVAHQSSNGVQLRMHSVPLVVGVGAKFDARRWSSLLTAMTLAHRVSFQR